MLINKTEKKVLFNVNLLIVSSLLAFVLIFNMIGIGLKYLNFTNSKWYWLIVSIVLVCSTLSALIISLINSNHLSFKQKLDLISLIAASLLIEIAWLCFNTISCMEIYKWKQIKLSYKTLLNFNYLNILFYMCSIVLSIKKAIKK